MGGVIKFILKAMVIILSVTIVGYSTYANITEDNKSKNSVSKKVIEERTETPNKIVIKEEETEIPKETVIEEDTKEINDAVENYAPEEEFDTKVERLIFEKMNEERRKIGIQEYSNNPTMTRYAKEKSRDMGNNGYFDHKDLSGNLITVKMKEEGVTYTAWAENIAWITTENNPDVVAAEFMENWMNSAGHKENILSTKYTSTGVGVYKAGTKIYATQEFLK